jgi:hypothetical protein
MQIETTLSAKTGSELANAQAQPCRAKTGNMPGLWTMPPPSKMLMRFNKPYGKKLNGR